MSHRAQACLALAVSLACAPSVPFPALALPLPAPTGLNVGPPPGDTPVANPPGPATNGCFTEYTGDASTDFSSPDAQALRDAVAAVAPGGTVKIAGTCAGAIDEGGSTQVARVAMKSLSLVGGYTPTNWSTSYPLTQPTTLDALGAGRVLYFAASDSDVTALIAQHGVEASGDGGAIFAGGTLALTDVTVISNTARRNGGGVFVSSELTLRQTQFISNTAGDYGGGAYANDAVILEGGLFLNNHCLGHDGGGLYAAYTLVMSATQFISNTAHNWGGGARVYNAAALTGGLFQDNWARTLGGGFFAVGTLTLTDTQFISNTAQQYGGGAFSIGAASLNGGLFRENKTLTFDGGGLNANKALAISGTQFIGNVAGQSGGGARAGGGSATLFGAVFEGNRATGGSGGGVVADYPLGTLIITNTRFAGNVAPVNGGGVYAAGALEVSAAQFISNAAQFGGGLYHGYSTARVVNSLFARNAALAGDGLALYLGSPGSVEIIHTTIAAPIAQSGSAIGVAAGDVSITDTLIASHTIGISNTGGTVNENYTLFDGVIAPRAGSVGAGANSFTGTALFVNPAADDYHLALGSAAIDAGINAEVATDFEGTLRPFGPGFDIGFDEWRALLRTYLPKVWR